MFVCSTLGLLEGLWIRNGQTCLFKNCWFWYNSSESLWYWGCQTVHSTMVLHKIRENNLEKFFQAKTVTELKIIAPSNLKDTPDQTYNHYSLHQYMGLFLNLDRACIFSLEFPEILSQNPICYNWLSVSGISIIMHCGILIDMPYYKKRQYLV